MPQQEMRLMQPRQTVPQENTITADLETETNCALRRLLAIVCSVKSNSWGTRRVGEMDG